MTYTEFQARSLRLQVAYIRRERINMRALDTMREFCSSPASYKVSAHSLGYHPLTAAEIADRLAELDDMEARAPESHGDSAGMRAAYQLHEGRAA